MKAAQITEYGDPSVVAVNDIPTPELREGHVLIEVHASSLNPFDSKIRDGAMKEAIPLQFPATLGGDIAGTVTEVSPDVTNITIGEKIYGQANVVAGNSGAFAEYAATSAKQISKMPENLDFKQAASLPLVGVSALQALTTHANLQPGQKIFIHGGAGGIGSIAIQIAKHIGAYVATTASDDDLIYVKDLGADKVVDYKSQDFSKVLGGYDVVFDTVGGEDFTRALSILKRGGIAVSMIARADEAKVQELGVAAISQQTHVTTEALDRLRELIEAGAITPQIAQVFSLEQIREAFETREHKSIRGKVVIEIR